MLGRLQRGLHLQDPRFQVVETFALKDHVVQPHHEI